MVPSPEQLLLQHLAFIERAARNGAWRHGLRPEDGADFVSDLKVKLIADDYAVIRKFRGQSAFTTYLTAVVQHYLLDYRNRLWGKWRPSAEAKRMGAGEDRVIVRMRMEDGFAVSEIARCLHLEAKPLYRRLEAILRSLRAALEREGVDAAAVTRLTEETTPARNWPFAGENVRARSSQPLGRL